MKYFLFYVIFFFTTHLFGQSNPALLSEVVKSYPIKRISLLADKRETAYEIVRREIKATDEIIKVYEVETWQPNNKIAKTIVANVISKNDDSLTINKLLLYYPIDSSSYGEFLLDTFKINKPNFKIQSVFTANFDEDEDFEIGILYSYSLLDECNVKAYRTKFYKKPKYLGIYWEFVLPIFQRYNDERFDCIHSNCRDSWYCKYNNEESIRKSLKK